MKAAYALQIETFKRAEKRLKQASCFNKEWIYKADIWWPHAPKGAVLKLQKSHWSNDGNGEIENDAKIFFSVWTDENDPDLLRYTIHAFKLRNLHGYKLESRKFASAFRKAFASLKQEWPNLSTDFGPQTLMEGFQKTSADTCEATIINLAARFLPAADLIDGLLAKAKRTSA